MSFQNIQDSLCNLASVGCVDTVSETCQRRLLNALQTSGFYALASGDLAALIRHVLRREAEQQGGNSPMLKVPRTSPFPKSRQVWDLSSMDILDEQPDYFLLSARPWMPDWLPDSEEQSPEVPLFQESPRRNYQPEPGDPFLAELDFNSYQSAGQRESIRSILTAPSQSTLLVNLPTGSGKSLCAHLPAWLKSKPVGVTVVVVPTVALAIDQERAFQEKTGINFATAYYSDTSIDGQERREEIRDRIRQGTQPIVFTSPEGLIESLAFSVYEATRQGFLRYLVIDEAHIVEQWGDEFRPEFQELAGLRRDLLRLSQQQGHPGFPTLLLTATVTESCLDTLETLFAQPGPFQLVSSVQLRPEPSYWFARCADETVRKQRLIEALHNLPRPLIVYGSKVTDVDRWHRELQSAGFKRCAKMTGKSSQQDRLQLLQDWRAQRIDLVVATSAFGLGVDLPDVRAVVHLCVPETIDRFYQEVGRGGRDGKATLSLTLYTQSDFEVASALSEITYITSDRGRMRWQAMFDRQETLPDGRFQVPINVSPPYNLDLDSTSARNQDWNIRTLTLMSRANLIEIDAEPPPQRFKFDSNEAFSKAIAQHRGLRTIQIRNDYHLSPETWQELVEPARNQRQQWASRSLSLMREALQSKRCTSEIFAEAYRIPARSSPPRRRVHVERSCGGCPFCRQQKAAPFSGVMPVPLPVWQESNFQVGEVLLELLAGESVLVIFYGVMQSRQAERDRNRLLQRLIREGILSIVAPQSMHDVFSKSLVFLFEDYQPLQMPKVPTLIYHPQDKALPSHYCQPFKPGIPLILFLPEDIPDPNANHRKLQDVWTGRSFRLDILRGELGL